VARDTGAANAVRSAAALLFLQLVIPDSVPPVVRQLAWVGAVSAGAQAAVSVVPTRTRQAAEKHVRQTGAHLMHGLGGQSSLPVRGLRGAQAPS
jgi:hypothetical protein